MTGFLYNHLQLSEKDIRFGLDNTKSPAFLSASAASSFAAIPSADCGTDSSGLLKKLLSLISGRPVVVACVGTDLVGGDCLGPLVGQMLVEADAPAFVYGTLKTPITALNLEEAREFIRMTHPDRLVIAVDSAVGAKNEEGLITVSDGPLRPGLALGKKLGDLGDVSVTVVTSAHSPEKKEFSLVRLGFVYKLARQVTGLILKSCIHAASSEKTFMAETRVSI